METFKHYVKHQDGYTVINRGNGQPFASEKEVQAFFGLLLQPSRFDVNREVNNGRGPVDYKISSGAFDKALIEFKLAKSSSLRRNLKNQVEVYERANKTDQSVKVVIVYTSRTPRRWPARSPRSTRSSISHRAAPRDEWSWWTRADNKPSASTV